MSFIIENFENKYQKIIFIGSTHEHETSEILLLKDIINNFKPEIILVEANFDKAKFKNEQESIEKGGEMGYVSFLARERGIKLISNDPSSKSNLTFLEEKYGRDFSFLYFFLRERSNLIKLNHFDKNRTDIVIIRGIKEEIKWDNYDYSLENIKRIFNELFKSELGDRDYTDFFNPTLDVNIFNKATKELNDFRDSYMLKAIKSIIKKYNKIFIIKGKHHLSTMKDKIKGLLRNG